jgi:hypothetical protein
MSDVKAIVAWVAVLGIQGALAEEQTEWQTPQQVLAAIGAGKAPGKPQVWHSPRGSVVPHGDLFGDGRHLALVGGGDTSWAVAKDGAWQVAGGLDVAPAWVPPGKTALEAGYDRSEPPPVPFVLKDLDGDRVPEVLVAFDNDGYRVGYVIARKEGQGIKLLDVRSERGEPEWIGGYLVLTTEDSGRKAWWSGDTYYQWRERMPEPVATWVADSTDPEKPRWISVRHAGAGTDRAFEITNDGGAWLVRSCRWEHGVETSEERDFGKIVITMDLADQEMDQASADAERALVFEMTTGIPGTVASMRSPVANDEGFDYAKAVAKLRVKVEGGDEAKEMLKLLSK